MPDEERTEHDELLDALREAREQLRISDSLRSLARQRMVKLDGDLAKAKADAAAEQGRADRLSVELTKALEFLTAERLRAEKAEADRDFWHRGACESQDERSTARDDRDRLAAELAKADAACASAVASCDRLATELARSEAEVKAVQGSIKGLLDLATFHDVRANKYMEESRTLAVENAHLRALLENAAQDFAAEADLAAEDGRSVAAADMRRMSEAIDAALAPEARKAEQGPCPHKRAWNSGACDWCANAFVAPEAKPVVCWRAGRTLGRTVYDDRDVCIGMMDTPELAAKVVAAVNATTNEVTGSKRRTQP